MIRSPLALLLAGGLAAMPAVADDPIAATDPCAVPKNLTLSRPDPAGTATAVAIGIYWIDVTEIDDASQAFTADFYAIASWTDPRLAAAARGGSLAACTVHLDDVWNPRILIVNRRQLDAELDQQVVVDESGRVEIRQRFYGELSAPLDLHDFPFDRQQLMISIASAGYGPEEVAFTVDSRSGRRPSFSIVGWDLELGKPRATAEYLEPLGRHLARIDFPISGRRHSGFYYWKMLVPLSLIVLMAWSVFWIDASVIPPRIGISTSAVFALIAFQLSLGRLLPPISYLTRADQFLMGSTFLVFLALGETVLAGKLARTDREDLAQSINRWSRWVYLVVFAMLLVVTVAI